MPVLYAGSPSLIVNISLLLGRVGQVFLRPLLKSMSPQSKMILLAWRERKFYVQDAMLI